jgi:5-methylcytosine-specific restriction protein A
VFEIGKEYRRKAEIHSVYGGQAQGGISTPKNHPFVFIFTSDQGEQHGYKDEYRDNGLFWYTGEGQIGNMKMDGVTSRSIQGDSSLPI